MLDLKLIRSEPERVKAALARRGAAEQVDRILALDERRRQLLPEIEGARSQRKQESEKIGALKKAGEDATAQMEAVRQLKLDLEQMEGELESVESELGEVSATLPNLPDPTSPDGYTDEDAELVREVGEIPEFGFETRDHVELAGDSIELEAAAKVSGARFAYLKGDLVMLEAMGGGFTWGSVLLRW